MAASRPAPGPSAAGRPEACREHPGHLAPPAAGAGACRGPAGAEARRGRPRGARPAWSPRGVRHHARPLRSPARRLHPGHSEHPGHPGHPGRPAHLGRSAAEARPAHQGHAEAAARLHPGPAAPDRPASWRRGGRHQEAYRPAPPEFPVFPAGSQARAVSGHRAPAARPDRWQDPQDRRARGPTQAAWARIHPPAHPVHRAAEAYSPGAHPAYPEHPAAEAASHPHPAPDAAEAPPCSWRRRRCPRRSERAAAPHRPTAGAHPAPADSRTPEHPEAAYPEAAYPAQPHHRSHRGQQCHRRHPPPPADTHTSAQPAPAEAYRPPTRPQTRPPARYPARCPPPAHRPHRPPAQPP